MNDESSRTTFKGQGNACLSCRQRKLKCDRRQPCANCSARSIECKQQLLPPVSKGVKKSLDGEATISSILSRLDRIEAIINQAQASGNENQLLAQVQDDHSTANRSKQFMRDEAHGVSNGVEKSRKIRRVRSLWNNDENGSKRIESPGRNELMRTESVQLASISANDNIFQRTFPHNLSFSVSTDSRLSVGEQNELLSIQLPERDETLRLFHVYLDYVGHFQHIIYEPHARQLIDGIYHQVSNVPVTFAPRGSALLFSILAISVLLEPLHGNLDSMISTIRDRLKICAVHMRAAFDCLEQARRRTDHTLENVQAMAVLGYLIYHIEALSPRYQTLVAEAFAVARILSLDQIDTPKSKKSNLSGEKDPIVEEMKRRVWWYLVATDWMVTIAGGTVNSAVTVQRENVRASLPLHINDEDLTASNPRERPLSQPTTMTYFIHRLKVAEMALSITDLTLSDPNEATYDMVVSADSKFQHFLDDLPTFFQMEKAESSKVRSIDEQYPFIPIQRLVINMMINLGRCRLHFPYLVGSPNEALHAFSRETCLKAAQHILAAHQDLTTSHLPHTPDFMKIQGTLHHMFMAAVILATDLCCNRPQGAEREQQSSELMRVFQTLADIKHHSQIVAKFLDSLTELLVKDGVWSPDELSASNEDNQQWQLGENSLESSYNGQQNVDMSFLFDDLWETFVQRPSAL